MASRKNLILGVISIAILLVSLAVMLLDIFVPLNFWTHPSLTFFFCAFVGFGITCFVLGFLNKSTWFFFLSSILLGLALFYAMMQYVAWWVGLIIVLVLWIIFAVLSVISLGKKTEYADNDNPDYKDYKQRREEKIK